MEKLANIDVREELQRKITYRLYPSASQSAKMEETLALHCRVYNTLLEEHQRRHQAGESRFTFSAMCRTLTSWRDDAPSLKSVNAQALQMTAKRVSLAFDAFFRRLKVGDTPGYPRFKAVQRFPGWGYKTYGDGWKLLQPEHRHGKLRLSGIGEIPMRGKGRFTGSPKTAEIVRKQDKWYVSVTYDVRPDAVSRPAGVEAAAFDWGLSTLLTIAKTDGSIEEVDNPRWLKTRLDQIQILSRGISAEETKIRARYELGHQAPIPFAQRTGKLKRLQQQLRAVHGKVSRQRKDFYHQITATLVRRFAFLGTEALAIANMSKAPKARPDPDHPGNHLPNGAARKAGLNRSILDAAPSMLLNLLRTKAAEAASVFVEANTRQLKPTQRCHRCGALVPKTLEQRIHRCACGCVAGRDENAAKTLLRWMLEGDFWSGTGQKTANSLSSETPPIAAFAV